MHSDCYFCLLAATENIVLLLVFARLICTWIVVCEAMACSILVDISIMFDDGCLVLLIIWGRFFLCNPLLQPLRYRGAFFVLCSLHCTLLISVLALSRKVENCGKTVPFQRFPVKLKNDVCVLDRHKVTSFR